MNTKGITWLAVAVGLILLVIGGSLASGLLGGSSPSPAPTEEIVVATASRSSASESATSIASVSTEIVPPTP
ncbi:MAG: hypothetical protein ACPGWR_32510, partial [Ardenticatenaceae bacterium]